jgi:hypothetical protein
MPSSGAFHHLCLREQMKPIARTIKKKELLKITKSCSMAGIQDEMADTYQTQNNKMTATQKVAGTGKMANTKMHETQNGWHKN